MNQTDDRQVRTTSGRQGLGRGIAVLAALAVAVVAAVPPLQGQVRREPRLFEGIRTETPLQRPSGARRWRTVRLDQRLIGGAYGALAPAPRLWLNLFPETAFLAVLDRYEQTGSGYAWIGKIDGVPLADVILVTVNGTVRGSVTLPGRTYAISVVDGVGTVSEQDEPRSLGNDAIVPGPEPSADRRFDRNGLRSAGADDGSLVDIAIVYSNNALRGAASEADLLAGIDLIVAEANQVFSNSGVGMRLRQVHTGPIDYEDVSEASHSYCIDDLARLKKPSDGFMDDIHALRDTTGADLVALVVASEYCGAGYLNNPETFLGGEYGFFVANWRESGFVFRHELGHNLGGHHDWYVESRFGAFSYSHGYVDLDGAFMTVMAYTNRCIVTSKPCSYILYFSTPELALDGRPLGVPAGTDDSCTAGDADHLRCDADNVRTFNEMARVVANYRPSATTGSTLAFPPRNETYDFRTELERTYRENLGRSRRGSYVNIEGSVVWVQEYLLYRLHRCSHESAIAKVRIQIAGDGLPAVCGAPAEGQIPFPPRDETLAFRLVLEGIYQNELNRSPSLTSVDIEGDIVWVQEYLRYRLNNCAHQQAQDKVLSQIAGQGIAPVCAA